MEDNLLPLGNTRAVLEQAENFTVLIKNQIYFPRFSVQRTNILDSQNESYLSSCHHSDHDPLCPVFNIGHIVQETGQNFSEISVKGGVINVDIEWKCDLDRDFMKHCKPRYTFSRLDDPNSKIAPGLNYRQEIININYYFNFEGNSYNPVKANAIKSYDLLIKGVQNISVKISEICIKRMEFILWSMFTGRQASSV